MNHYCIFSYNDPFRLVKKQTTTASDGSVIRSDYIYPIDSLSKPIYQGMKNNNMIAPVLNITRYIDNVPVEIVKTNYKAHSSSLYLPESIQMKIGANPIETILLFKRYDFKGNLLEFVKPNGPTQSYIWGYNGQYPIAKISNSSYDDAFSKINEDILLNTSMYTEDAIRQELNKIRTGLPNAGVTAYTYNPIWGMTSETDIAGRTNYYRYDGFGRLKGILDQDKNVLESYRYQYKQD